LDPSTPVDKGVALSLLRRSFAGYVRGKSGAEGKGVMTLGNVKKIKLERQGQERKTGVVVVVVLVVAVVVVMVVVQQKCN
jgi:hypothetical protein